MLASSLHCRVQGTPQTRQKQQGRNVRRARAAVRVQAEQQQGEPPAGACSAAARVLEHEGALQGAHQRAPLLADAAEPLMVRAARGEAIERAPCW